MRGKLEKIEERGKGEKRYWMISIDGDNYSVWKPEYLEGLEVGSTVDYEFSRKGRFRNITDLRVASGDAPAQAESGPPVESEGFVPNDLITNMTSLKYAAMTMQNAEGDPVDKAVKTLEISEVYKAYMKGEDYKVGLRDLRQQPELGPLG